MRILRFIDRQGRVHWGKPIDGGRALPMAGDLFGEHCFAGEPLQVVRRLAPVDPPNILAIGRNYPEHAKEMASSAGEVDHERAGQARRLNGAEPLVFLKATTSVIGPDDAIILPRSAPDEVDFEGELAVIVGRTAKDVGESRALEYVFGYTCANDVTARDCQKRRDKQWARAKGFDTFCPLGPELVTRDELDAGSLHLRSMLNGQVMQDGNTSDMVFSVPALVSYLSHQFTLPRGTVILTGTPPGVGYARRPQVFLRNGDEICIEIEGIGRLANRVRNTAPGKPGG